MQDRRLINRLTSYWDILRKDSVMPQWEHFNSAVISDIWPQCCELGIEPSKGTNVVYTYTYVGKSVIDAIGKDVTGTVMATSLGKFPGVQVVQRMAEVVETKKYIVDESQFVNEKSVIVKYRSCLLPFGRQQNRVSHVLLGLSWRSYQ